MSILEEKKAFALFISFPDNKCLEVEFHLCYFLLSHLHRGWMYYVLSIAL